jgi:hypothetical protein
MFEDLLQATAAKNCPLAHAEEWHLLILLGGYTGQRRSDCAGLKGESVDFSGGVYSSARKNQLAANMLALGVNLVIEKNGQLMTRWGTSRVGTDAATANRVLGLAYFDTPALEWLLRVIQNGATAKVQQHDGDAASAWTDVAGFTPDADAPVEIVPAVDKLYFFNGVDRVRSWDGSAWVTLGSTTTDAPLAALAEWCNYRMFAAGVATAPDTVYFSDILDASDGHWGHVAKSFRVGAGEGDPITALRRWTGTNLAVLKRSSLWVANVDPTVSLGATMALECVHDSIGCLSHRTVRRVGNDLFFLAADGVRSMQQSIADQQSNQVTPPVSEPVKDMFQRINPAAAGTACAEAFNHRYLIAIPVDGAAQPNVVLCFNALRKCWEGYWTGQLPTGFARSYFAGLQRLNWGQSDGRVMQWRNWVLPANETASDFADAGTAIATTCGLRSHNFQEPKNDKKGLVVELEFDENRADEVTVTAYRDEAGTGETLATLSSGLNAGITFPVSFPLTFPAQGIKRVPLALDDLEPFRELALNVSAPSGKLALRSARLTAFLETMPIGR